MLYAGFTGAPVTRMLVIYVIAASALASATDMKHHFYINVSSHLWRHRQFWRLLTWQACFTNATEIVFGAISLYQLRVVERLWGSRKFLSFLTATSIYVTLLPPLLLTFVLRPLSPSTFNYLPAGPTAVILALLAQYHAAIPYTYHYRLSNSANASTDSDGLLVTSKSLSYLVPLQLAMAQLPGSLIPAAVGWVVGYAWRADLLPFPSSGWRIPGWILGVMARPRSVPTEGQQDMRSEVVTATGADQAQSSAGNARQR